MMTAPVMKELRYIKNRNKYVPLHRCYIKSYFVKIIKYSMVTSENFWKTIKHFLTSMGNFENPVIMLQDKGNTLSDESVLVTISTKMTLI